MDLWMDTFLQKVSNNVQNKPNHTTDINILILSEPCYYCTDDFVDLILV